MNNKRVLSYPGRLKVEPALKTADAAEQDAGFQREQKKPDPDAPDDVVVRRRPAGRSPLRERQ